MKYNFLVTVFIILLLSVYLLSSDGQDISGSEVSVEQVYEKVKTDSTVFLIDVRTSSEFNGTLGHIPGSVLITLGELEARLDELRPFKDRDMIVICRSSNRSGVATKMLRENGFKAFNMIGGMRAWNKMIKSTEPDITRN
jgi:rhodanese-related sulfurtransferase